MNATFVQDKVKGIILLKAASVIGEVFTLKQLEFISPLVNEDVETIMEIMIDLQSRDFIEIIDDNDAKNWICRFTKKFLRETLYQRLLLRGQKKYLHQLSADYIQNHPNLEPNPDTEQKRLLHHILVSEDLKSEEKMSLKAKNALTVKRLTHIVVDKKKKIIFDGFLTKQGQRTSKNIEPRYVRLTRGELEWFHNQEEAKYNKVPLGSIAFQSIFQVLAAKRDLNTSDIYIDCMSWKKKNIEKGTRKFVFGAKTENERDEWIACIEYMRTKSIHDHFTKKFANITLPIESSQSKSRKIGSNSTNFEGQTSLGTMIKKQTEVSSQTTVGLRKLGSNKKGSIMVNLMDKKRLSSFSIDSMQTITQENLIKDTAAKIKSVFNAHMAHFFGQIAENSIKGNAFQANVLGKSPECLKNINFCKGLNIGSGNNSKGMVPLKLIKSFSR